MELYSLFQIFSDMDPYHIATYATLGAAKGAGTVKLHGAVVKEWEQDKDGIWRKGTMRITTGCTEIPME